MTILDEVTRRVAIAIRHVAFEDLGILAPVLERRGFRVRCLDAGVDPIDPGAVAGAELLVVLGGPIGVYDEEAYPFLGDERAAISERLRTGAPTLGVCLGAQLMAAALGAPVEATGSKEIGYSPLRLTDAGRRTALAPLDGVPVLHWHGDEFQTPSGASRLAETPVTRNQAFAMGSHARLLALQFHIEADPTRIERWLIGHAVELAAAGVDPRVVRGDAKRYGPALAHVAERVFDTWLDDAIITRPPR